MVLERINGPEDIRKIPKNELPRLAQEIRSFLIESTSVTGGHLASNLGVVELTMAMYLAFQPPKDKIIWDVGHQSYTHKILSGRKNAFAELRRFGGIAGFPKRGRAPATPSIRATPRPPFLREWEWRRHGICAESITILSP